METFTSKKTWKAWNFLNEGTKLSGVKRKQMGKIINHQRKWHLSYGFKLSRNSLDKESYKEWKSIPKKRAMYAKIQIWKMVLVHGQIQENRGSLGSEI